MEICLETAFGDMRSAELMLVQGFPKSKLVTTIAARFANLEIFKAFSTSSVTFIPRIKGIDFMFSLQKYAEAFQFRHF